MGEFAKWLVCSDIFGETDALNQQLAEIFGDETNFDLFSPYPGKQYFLNEDAAYTAFCRVGGIHAYVSDLVHQFTNHSDYKGILGFSAGAAAAWKAVSLANLNKLTQVIGFYPGQIQHFLDADASVPTYLIFPHYETHFEVEPVIHILLEKPQVKVERTQYQHGFMNTHSKAYDAKACQHFMEKIQAIIRV